MGTSDETRRTAYRVEVVRSGGWWAITVPALDGVFFQTRRLDQVDASAREAISLALDIEGGAIGDLDIVVTPPARVADLLETLRASLAVADEATRAATDTRREVAELLRAEGLPLRDVGRLIGLSHQRVSQLLAG